MKLLPTMLAGALLVPAFAALASTDCAATVTSITIETGGGRTGYVVSLSSGLSFAMSPKSEGYREVFALAMTSQNTGHVITARFATDSVNCSRVARRTDLIAVVVGPEETTTTTPLPPSATRDVFPPPPR